MCFNNPKGSDEIPLAHEGISSLDPSPLSLRSVPKGIHVVMAVRKARAEESASFCLAWQLTHHV